ncbi:phospholipase A2 inhibitor NAI-like isoform X4 [Podarcis raffonei]|uniref:phospholipase A2 inhibitor NAI-like isoform X4 n=1 Tax=Podarcis raffonei TaxID=65483 RepID=UPI00232967C9|nr:phospholipase A2 inhibitor NAI-like isoform X4 [Podarcis raffonei]
MQTLLRSFLFFVLLTKGNSLECETCTDVGTSCMGRMKTCVEGQDTCIVVFLESIIDGKVLQTVVKGCASSEKCSYPPKHMTIGKGKSIRTSLSCCTGSDCASIVPPRCGEFRDIIMKGCTIKSTCAAMNKGIPPILEEKDTIVVNARCTPDPSRGSRSSGLYLPIFSGLLFLQIPW